MGRRFSWNDLAETLSFSSDLATGETAATEVQRRGNEEGARNAPVAKSLEKQGLETREWKKGCLPMKGYPLGNLYDFGIVIR